jgi:hypothetical protein
VAIKGLIKLDLHPLSGSDLAIGPVKALVLDARRPDNISPVDACGGVVFSKPVPS